LTAGSGLLSADAGMSVSSKILYGFFSDSSTQILEGFVLSLKLYQKDGYFRHLDEKLTSLPTAKSKIRNKR
jgi:hypothetical protein